MNEYDLGELYTLTDDAEPGTYEVMTKIGAVYEARINPDRSTTIARRSLTGTLYGDGSKMAADHIEFVVGDRDLTRAYLTNACSFTSYKATACELRSSVRR